MKPEITLYNRHPSAPVQMNGWLEKLLQALPLCLKGAKDFEAPLLSLSEIEISLVTDEEITQLHADFLDDPTPTDVITFHHGEILVSLDTAKRQSIEHAESYDREVVLYMIHGLLHLGGWDDHEPIEREAMHDLQDSILDACYPVKYRLNSDQN
jgi:probable rRNA maturation factor